MTNDQLTNELLEIHKEQSKQAENIKSAHKRIDDNDKLTSQIHDIAKNIATLTEQVKTQGINIEKMITSYEERMKSMEKHIKDLEGKSGKRWEAIVTQFIGIAIAGIGAFLLAKLGM